MAAIGQELIVAKQGILTARIDEEALTEVVRFYLILRPKEVSLLHHPALCRYVDVQITVVERLCLISLCH